MVYSTRLKKFLQKALLKIFRSIRILNLTFLGFILGGTCRSRWTFRQCCNSETQSRQLLESNQPKCSNPFGPRQMSLPSLYLPQYKNCTHADGMPVCNTIFTADSPTLCDTVAPLQQEYVGSPSASEVRPHMDSGLLYPNKNFHFLF